jgi:hypothetical protein
MTATSAEQFLLGGGGRSAKFDTVGASITGTVASAPEVKQQTDMSTGKPLTWDNGDPRLQLVVTLQTTLHDEADDDGIRKLYVKGSKDPASKSLHAAVAGAVQAAGAKGLDIGGVLTVTYIGNGVSKTPGFNPPKQYQATYKAPDAGEFLGTVNTTTGEITQQATAPDGPTPEKVAALRAAGIDPATVFPGFTG